jgi:DNA-binding response OmpR family regulator
MKLYESRPRIVVVENDQDTLFLIETGLKKNGYIVESFNAGSEIVEFKHEIPQLFILDHGLPTIDGIAISKFLRVQESTRHIPIIMISGLDVQQRAKLAGIDHFIRKPFQINELLSAIEDCLHRVQSLDDRSS